MINENKGVLAPSVFKRFSCKGAACRYNCCRDWSITMSRDEYRGWKKCGILPKGKLENEKVHLCPEKLRSERIYAEILLDDEGKCPYLSEYGLCQLQMDYGVKEMTATCRLFPRHVHQYFGHAECSLSMGCEKVLELLLEEKEGIILEKLPAQNFEIYSSNFGIRERRKHPRLKSYFDIQTLCLALLQAEELAMENRLILLGMSIQTLDRIYENETADREKARETAAAYVLDFLSMVQQSETGNILKRFPEEKPLSVFNSVTSALLTIGFSDKFQNDILVRAGKAVTAKKEQGAENPELEYYQECRKLFAHWIAGKEYFLENVMVMFLLWFNIPFHEQGKNLWENYLYLVWVWVMLKGILCLSTTEESTVEDMIDRCTVLFRKVGHNKQEFLDIIDAFQKEGDTLAHVAILLRSC